ncbi:MAG TPA: hypothetical protein VGB38_01550 [bacterium]
MLGLGDFWVVLVFVLTLCSVLLCVVYGIVKWNKDGEPSKKELAEEKRWDREEKKIEKKL